MVPRSVDRIRPAPRRQLRHNPGRLRRPTLLGMLVLPARAGRDRVTGSYGAGLTRHLHANDIAVVEVDRPNRQRRGLSGKSDPQDAISAARAAQSGDASSVAKTRDGAVESLRVLRVARCSARNAKAQALNQMRGLASTAPDEIRTQLRRTTGKQLVARCSKFRSTGRTDPTSVTKIAVRSLAWRINDLVDELAELDQLIEPIVNDTAPDLVALTSVGPEIASALLVAAGDNPNGSATKPRSLTCAGSRRSTPAPASSNDTASTAAATESTAARSGGSCSPASSTTLAPATTSNDAPPRGSRRRRRSGA